MIRSNIYAKSELIANGFNFKASLMIEEPFQQLIKSSEYLGKFLAIFLQLKDDDPNKILDLFKFYL